MTQPQTVAPPVRRLGVLIAVYLLGIFMGAIDTGIVTPARTIIQNDLGVNDTLGIWLLTIYTLAYAASIPVMGKLADRFGRKPIYLVSITLFGLGSLMCGLSQDVGSFAFLIFARAVQAIGGGGIVPIATAEFGTSVPPEKRGMALGLVGGVYGVANIFGASAGSLILDLFGTHNWQYIFYVNVPISIVIIGLGLAFLPNHKAEQVSKIDLFGITVLVAMILSLLRPRDQHHQCRRLPVPPGLRRSPAGADHRRATRAGPGAQPELLHPSRHPHHARARVLLGRDPDGRRVRPAVRGERVAHTHR